MINFASFLFVCQLIGFGKGWHLSRNILCYFSFDTLILSLRISIDGKEFYIHNEILLIILFNISFTEV